MKKGFFGVRIVYTFVLALVFFLLCSVGAFASEAEEPIVSFDYSPDAVIGTVYFVFGFIILLILALIFLLRHFSDSKKRVRRLSKIASDDTIFLYDDLDEAKWKDDADLSDKPRDIVLDDDYSKSASKKGAGTSDPIDTMPTDTEPHGPTPERDMPGYDPRAAENKDELEPVSLYGPTGAREAYPRSAEADKRAGAPAQPMYQPAPPAVPYEEAQPVVYTLDGDVEIVMRGIDDTDAPKQTSFVAVNNYAKAPAYAPEISQAEAEVDAPARVRAYRRRGKVPGLVTGTEPGAVASRRAYRLVPSVSEGEFEGAEGAVMPRMNFRHMSVFPNGNPFYSSENAVEQTAQSEDITVKLSGINEAPKAPESEAVFEAPIFDTGAPDTTKASGITANDIIVRLVPKDEPEVEEQEQSLSLNQVLDEMEEAEAVTELETVASPVREEELVFLGGGQLSEVDIDTDEIFDNEEGEARMFINGKYTTVKYKTSFLSRFIQAEEQTQDYYSVIKNVLLSYGVQPSLSWTCESFSSADKVCAKINIESNTVMLYLALDPERYRNYKYHYTYAAYKYSANKYNKYKYKDNKVPLLIKVKGERALKYALELIVALMDNLSLTAGVMPDVDYRRPYETIGSLVDRGLIKLMHSDADAPQETDEALKGAVEAIASTLDGSETAIAESSEEVVFDFSDDASAKDGNAE